MRDAPAARSVEDRRVRPLLRSHRRDDGLNAVELAVVDLHSAELAAKAGDHLQQSADRPHATNLLELVEEVVEGELLLSDLALELLGLALVELALGLLDERHHVAHAEDALGHAVGVEALERVELLAGGRVEDRLARDRFDRERGATPGVTVELREDDAVEVSRVRELLRHVHRVLSSHRVDHEQHVVRLDGLADADQLGHELLVDVQAAGGVDDQDVLAVGLGLVERPRGDVHWVATGALFVHGRAHLLAHLHELIDRGRPIDVAGREGHVASHLLADMAGELRARRRLA